jgi:hypothetical protein
VADVEDDLQALVYVSTASHLLSAVEIDHLLQRARQRNAQQRVTGVLLYDEGNFIQYLEGPSVGISTVYDFILRDTLHGGIIEIVREPIQAREFEEWLMAFRTTNALGMTRVNEEDSRLTERLTPNGSPVSAQRILLLQFWNKEKLRLH